jgi:FkbM family methyltransferase
MLSKNQTERWRTLLPQTWWCAAKGLLRGAQYGLQTFLEVWGISLAGRLKAGSVRSFGKFTVETVDGTSFGVLRWHINQRRYYDFETDNPAPAILDCGSNIGLSILRFKELYPQARVTGFEPDPTIFPILKRNIERNRCTGVKLIQAALTGSNDSVSLLSDGERLSFVGHPDEPLLPGWHRFEVPSVNLADFVDTGVDFMKMNIEGAERDVIIGLGPKIRQIRQMVFEYHHRSGAHQSLHEILEFLRKNGFEYVINSYAQFTNPRAHPPFGSGDNTHTLAVYARQLE